MRLSYYTIDDLRLGHDPKGVTGWRLSQFLNWRDALEHYHSLPNDRVKEFGLSNGVQVLQLVRCLPLFPTDRTGYDVLLTDSIVQPLWRNETQALEVAQAAPAPPERDISGTGFKRPCQDSHAHGPQAQTADPGKENGHGAQAR